MLILEGNCIDNWILHISYICLNELLTIIDEENKLYKVKGEFSTSLLKSTTFFNNNFDKRKIDCKTFVEMIFPLEFVPERYESSGRSYSIYNISTINNTSYVLFEMPLNVQPMNL